LTSTNKILNLTNRINGKDIHITLPLMLRSFANAYLVFALDSLCNKLQPKNKEDMEKPDKPKLKCGLQKYLLLLQMLERKRLKWFQFLSLDFKVIMVLISLKRTLILIKYMSIRTSNKPNQLDYNLKFNLIINLLNLVHESNELNLN